jgi:replicative DNA helicase
VALKDKNIELGDVLTHWTGRPLEYVCRDIKSLNNFRKTYSVLETSLKEIKDADLDEFIPDLQRKLVSANAGQGFESSSADSIISEYKELQAYYKERFASGQKIIGVSTGYDKLDEIIDGLRQGHLWVIGGYTNMGKTATSLNIASNVIKQGKRVVYYSLEMSKTDILSRLLGIMTKESGLAILKGSKYDFGAVAGCMELISKSESSIYNEKTELSAIEGSMLEENLNRPVDLFIVDFLQLITLKGAKSEYESVSTAILELQQTAKKLKVPIIVLSQVSNEGAKYNNEVVMSFKGSGSIAAAADLAIEINIGETDKELWKIKMHKGEPVKMLWNVRKNRHGKVGSLEMAFDGRTGVFKLEDHF